MFESGIVGHLGGSSSLAEIVSCLYFAEMRISKELIERSEERDFLVLSKGHAVLIQYAALVELGVIPARELTRLKVLNGMLQGHPDMRKTPGIEANTGSLGQGLSISLGIALGHRLSGDKSRVFVILGDGELAEGQVWEAAMAIPRFGIDSVVAIIDRNRYQATGATKDRFDIPDIGKKWEAFGWHVYTVDGHDIPGLLSVFEQIKTNQAAPSVIIADTIKGKGFPFAEDSHLYHNRSLTPDELKVARDLLDGKDGMK